MYHVYVHMYCICYVHVVHVFAQARVKAEQEEKKKEEKELRRALARQKREEFRLAQQVDSDCTVHPCTCHFLCMVEPLHTCSKQSFFKHNHLADCYSALAVMEVPIPFL